MADGTYTYYTIQHRRTHESPWLKPKAPLIKAQQKDWHFSSFDSFGFAFEPWLDFKPKYPKSQNETHDVWAKTSHKGWWTLKYAVRALKRARKASEEGKFDSRDSYNTLSQAVRYEFRIVKMVVSQQTEAVSCDELLEVLT